MIMWQLFQIIIPLARLILSDSANFLGSADLIDYAKKKKWYNPDKDGDFNFREAYGEPKNLGEYG